MLPNQVWQKVGKSKNYRFIATQKIRALLGPEFCNNLLSFHAISGCDTTSQFCGIGKKGAWKVYQQNPSLLNGIGYGALSPEKLKNVEKFVVSMYAMKSSLTSVDDLRAQLFCTESAEKLPPTQDAVIQHAKRAHNQASIWHHALEAKPSLPTPKEYGWKEDDNGNLIPFLMTKLPILVTCIALISLMSCMHNS